MSNITDWAINLIIGTVFAFYTAAQGGIEGDLAISDLLLPFTGWWIRPKTVSGDNVVIGFDSWWARIMLKKLESKYLPFCYLLLDYSSPAVCGCCRTRGPGLDILPNMFHGLVSDDGDFKVVHRKACIRSLPIDIRATEFAPDALRTQLEGKDNQTACNICRSIVARMKADVDGCANATCWDKDMFNRINDLMERIETPDPEIKIIEALDRIHKRLSDTLYRLGLVSFTVDGVSYTIKDVYFACIICLGINRAKAMSDYIYDANALVLMGYNITVAREMIRDSSRTAAITEEHDHYATRLTLDTTSYPRLVDIEVNDYYIFFGQILDSSLALALASLTMIDPILCMAISRILTAAYRGRRGQLSTSVSWSISRVMLRYTGLARDDWMACFVPVQRVHRRIFFSILLSFLATLVPLYIWSKLISFVYPSELLRQVAMYSCIVGLVWIVAVCTMHHLKLWKATVFIGFLASLVVAARLYTEWSPVLQFCAVAFVFLQWVYGELWNEWIHKSASLFAFGVLGALRFMPETSHPL